MLEMPPDAALYRDLLAERTSGESTCPFVPSRKANLMGQICGNLWEYNLCRVVVVDVSDDYRLMQPPMPSDFYPVLREIWMPRYLLAERLPDQPLVRGYLYDWHEIPNADSGLWYVGVVQADLAGN
jgi:hypothetical protein